MNTMESKPMLRTSWNVTDVGSLVLPVCHEDSDVVFAKYHIGVLLEGFPRYVLRILAADGEDDSPPSQFSRPELNLTVSLSDPISPNLDAIQAVILR